MRNMSISELEAPFMMDWPNEKHIQIKAYIVVHPFHIYNPKMVRWNRKKWKQKQKLWNDSDWWEERYISMHFVSLNKYFPPANSRVSIRVLENGGTFFTKHKSELFLNSCSNISLKQTKIPFTFPSSYILIIEDSLSSFVCWTKSFLVTLWIPCSRIPTQVLEAAVDLLTTNKYKRL